MVARVDRDSRLDRSRATRSLAIDRVRRRFAASVYGNVLVLGAVVSPISPAQTRWAAVAVVLATVASTYVAHVTAHLVSERIGRAGTLTAGHRRAELRDAVPILSSGVAPALILSAGAAGLINGALPLAAAGLLVVVRLAASGMYARHTTGSATPIGVVWSGLVLEDHGLG